MKKNVTSPCRFIHIHFSIHSANVTEHLVGACHHAYSERVSTPSLKHFSPKLPTTELSVSPMLNLIAPNLNAGPYTCPLTWSHVSLMYSFQPAPSFIFPGAVSAAAKTSLISAFTLSPDNSPRPTCRTGCSLWSYFQHSVFSSFSLVSLQLSPLSSHLFLWTPKQASLQPRNV